MEKVREDFPILKKLKDEKPIIYADSACMALKPKQVVDALISYYTEFTACAGRSPHAFSRKTTKLYEEARKSVASFINAKDPSEIVWTRNTTEALNLGCNYLKCDGTETIIATSDSHNSNLVKWMRLHELGKVTLEVITINLEGQFNLEKFTEIVDKCQEGKFLASLNHVSNVTAAQIPVKEISNIVHEKGGILQLDAAQSFPAMPLDVQELGVDLLGVSMHKACGPTGMGFLYGKYEILEEIEPLILGGETISDLRLPNEVSILNPPSKFEAGLQNYAGTIATGAAIDYLKSLGMDNILTHERVLSRAMIRGLEEILGDKVEYIGPKNPDERTALAAINLKEINCHEVAILLDDMFNIFLRSGFHCTHAYHHSIDLNSGTLRPSWYLYNTVEEIDNFINALSEIIDILG